MNRAEGKPQQTRKVINMKNQIVYVVTDKASDTIVGVFNEYKIAQKVADNWQEVKDSREEEVAVTPVAVDCSVDVQPCYTFEDLENTLTEVFKCVRDSEFENENEEDEEEIEEEEISPEVFKIVDKMLDSLYNWPEEEKEEEEEEEDEEEECYSLTPKGEFFLKLLDSGIDYDEALKIADIIFDEKEDGE